MSSTEEAALPKHPAEAQSRRVLAFGVVFCLMAGGAVAIGVPLAAPGLVAVGGLFTWLGARSTRSLRVVQLNNLAFDRLTRGELDAAEALLARADGRARGYVLRAIRLQQALVALSKGEPARAVAAATDAATIGTSLLTRALELRAAASALSIRAVAHAALGRSAEAEADAQAAIAAPEAGPEALGRAALARMVLASRADDLDRLAQLLRESGRATATLLPRERVLVRAFRRMIAAGGSVYRRQGRRDEPAGEGALRAWASAMAPAAAGFVDGTGAGESAGGEVPLEAPSREAHEALERDQGARGAAGTKARGRRIGALVAAWAVLAAGVFACLEILAPVGRGAHGASADELPTSLVSSFGGGLFSLVVLAMGGLVVARLRRSDRAGARLQAATRHAAKGDLDAAVAVYRELLVGAQNPMTKASAHLGLADVAEERASFDEALREVDLGIGLLEGQKTWRAAASDILLPELHGARAWLLARAGRTDEANAELALVARDFPTYPFATRTRHRVRLVAAVTAGDLDAARDLVRRRAPEMPLSVRDELLGDLVLATADPTTPEGERERLATDLREDARLAAWLAAVAPRLAGALAGGPSVRLAEVAEVEAAVADESEPGAARAREV